MSSLTPRLDRLDKNYIINGNFDFWQRGTLLVVGPAVAGGNYLPDRGRVDFASSTNSTIQAERSTDVPNIYSKYSHKVTLTSVGTLNANSYLLPYHQQIEGTIFSGINKKSVTVSFYIKCSVTGTFNFVVKKHDNSRTYVTTFSINSANTWEKKVINLDLDQVGTYNTDNTLALKFQVATYSGSTYQTSTLNTWQNGDFLAATGSTNWFTTGATMNISQVQLIEGTHSDPEFSTAGRNYAEELRLCQRYYTKSYNLDEFPGAITTKGVLTANMAPVNAPTANHCTFYYPVRMRANPAITLYNPSTGATGTWRDNGGGDIAVSSTDNGTNGTGVSNTGAVIASRYCIGHIVVDAEL